MGAQIRYDPGIDSVGERTITTNHSAIGRFNDWRVLPAQIGETAHAVGDGRRYHEAHRTDYGAAFTLRHIPHTQMALLNEFLEYANAGMIFAIDTADVFTASYAEVQLAPGFFAELSEPDPVTLEYTLPLQVINMAVAPVPLVCFYDAGPP